MQEITEIIESARLEGRCITEALIPLVYDELKQMATRKLAKEKPGQSINATVLVHELFLRLSRASTGNDWQNRAHFFAASAECMRRILVDQARHRARLKRGGQFSRIDIDLSHFSQSPRSNPDAQLTRISDALDRFAHSNPQEAELVKLRFFAGVTMEEAAEIQGISLRTAQRHWRFAKARMFQLLDD